MEKEGAECERERIPLTSETLRSGRGKPLPYGRAVGGRET